MGATVVWGPCRAAQVPGKGFNEGELGLRSSWGDRQLTSEAGWPNATHGAPTRQQGESPRVGREIRCAGIRVSLPGWGDRLMCPSALSNLGAVGTRSGHKDRKKPTKAVRHRHDAPRLTSWNVTDGH